MQVLNGKFSCSKGNICSFQKENHQDNKWAITVTLLSQTRGHSSGKHSQHLRKIMVLKKQHSHL
jgi:hypothetical protein